MQFNVSDRPFLSATFQPFAPHFVFLINVQCYEVFMPSYDTSGFFLVISNAVSKLKHFERKIYFFYPFSKLVHCCCGLSCYHIVVTDKYYHWYWVRHDFTRLEHITGDHCLLTSNLAIGLVICSLGVTKLLVMKLLVIVTFVSSCRHLLSIRSINCNSISSEFFGDVHQTECSDDPRSDGLEVIVAVDET